MSEMRPCAFLDRDGTLIEERNYLADPDQAVLLPHVVDGLRALTKQGFRLIIVSNQSGIGRGYFSDIAANAVNQRVIDMLTREGVEIAACYMCPHRPEEQCHCRKPQPGMIEKACQAFSINLASSIVIGDNRTDLQLATNAQMRGFLVTTGHGKDHVAWAHDNGFAVFPDILSITRSWHSL